MAISQHKITYYLKKPKQILGKQAINKLKKSINVMKRVIAEQIDDSSGKKWKCTKECKNQISML